MSIPRIHKEGATLHIKIKGGFNLWVKNMITNHISSDIHDLIIDLSTCTFIDSEGIIFLYTCHKEGKSVQLINPPDLFFELLSILQLDTNWQPNILKANEETS